ncbi:MAG: hypothetical protein R3250_05835 [Melioribacteraceae bacterium]|nr:hypothetical protein [Melioribacteraceae bacterium]
MAGEKNRTELSTYVQGLAALHTEEDYKETLDDNIINSVVTRKDVVISEAAVDEGDSFSFVTDYDNADQVICTGATGDYELQITINNTADGDILKLKIQKGNQIEVDFTNATDETPAPQSVVTALTEVVYLVYNVNSTVYVKAITNTIFSANTTREGILETATQTESNSLSAINKIVTPGTIPIASTTQRGVSEYANNSETIAGSSSTLAVTPSGLKATLDNQPTWQTLSLLPANWAVTSIDYFKDHAGVVRVRFRGLRFKSSLFGVVYHIATLPTGYRPANNLSFPCAAFEVFTNVDSVLHTFKLSSSNGYIYIDPNPNTQFLVDYDIHFEFSFATH